MPEHEDREASLDRLWQHQREWLEAEQPGARCLQPKRERWFVDREDAPRVERAVEQVMRTYQHAADRCRVIFGPEAAVAEVPQPRDHRHQNNAGQRQPAYGRMLETEAGFEGWRCGVTHAVPATAIMAPVYVGLGARAIGIGFPAVLNCNGYSRPSRLIGNGIGRLAISSGIQMPSRHAF